AVLVTVADVLRLHLRAADVIGRYGGEEFLLLLPSTDREHASLAARRLLQAIACHDVAIGDGRTLRITGSAGVACAAELEESASVDALLQLADERLYQAKGAGRNCVVP